MDSGANVSVTNPLTVSKFNLTPQRWERPFHIIFGNGARFHCTHYAHFGPILGQVAIVDGAPDTLLSVAVLTARGYEVRFLPNGQGVGIYKSEKLLFHGPQHEQSRLFHIDIQSLIHPPTDIDKDPHDPLSTDPDPQPSIAKKGRPHYVANSAHLDLNTARDVLWLHKRMGHPSRLTMYQSIMHGTWTGLPDGLKPAQVNKILKNVHCLSCELSKRNKNPPAQGDGFHALLPGEEISVDYQGKIEPPSVRGFTGFYLFKDSCTGHRHAVMVNSKDAAT
jgi:hypothetical protein